MNKFKLNTLALLLFAPSVFAVQYGSDVDSDTYEEMNYFVNYVVEDTDTKCGGQIIAGKWLLTARHCTPSWDADGDEDYSDDDVVNGEDSISISVYQGVGGKSGYSDGNSRLVYSGTATYYTFGDTDDVDLELETELDDSGLMDGIESIAYTYDENGETSELGTNIASYSNDSTKGADLALIKLDSAIQYINTVELGDASDENDMTDNLPSSLVDISEAYDAQAVKVDDELSFYGWGHDENDDQPDLMQTAVATISRAPIEITCKYYFDDSDGDLTSVTCSEIDTVSLDDEEARPFVRVYSRGDLYSDEILNSGDSGTALMSDNVAYGLASTTSTSYSSYTYIGPYRDWIAETVESLNVPKTIELLTSDSRSTMTISVQNLTSESISFTPYVESGDVSIDYSACSTTLDSLESCDIEVTIEEPTSYESFSIQMDDDTLTTVNYVTKYTGTYYSDSDSDSDSDSSSSSGGSTGVFSLFAMCLMAFARKRYATKAQ